MSGDTNVTTSPANNEELGIYAKSGPADVDAAVAAAKAAQVTLEGSINQGRLPINEITEVSIDKLGIWVQHLWTICIANAYTLEPHACQTTALLAPRLSPLP